jgi:hypothetical protein
MQDIFGEGIGQQAIVRADVSVAADAGRDGPTRTADSGIDDEEMDRAWGEIAVRRFQGERPCADILWRDVVGEVDKSASDAMFLMTPFMTPT